jgi:hypothetical protein
MNAALTQLFKFGVSIPVNLDKAIARVKVLARLWSDKFFPGKTLSFQFGAKEAEILYVEWILYHRVCKTVPYIDLAAHPLGQFSEAICTAIQSMGSGRKRWHGLECFLHDKVMLAKFELQYPGIEAVVRYFLKSQGVKV